MAEAGDAFTTLVGSRGRAGGCGDPRDRYLGRNRNLAAHLVQRHQNRGHHRSDAGRECSRARRARQLAPCLDAGECAGFGGCGVRFCRPGALRSQLDQKRLRSTECVFLSGAGLPGHGIGRLGSPRKTLFISSHPPSGFISQGLRKRANLAPGGVGFQPCGSRWRLGHRGTEKQNPAGGVGGGGHRKRHDEPGTGGGLGFGPRARRVGLAHHTLCQRPGASPSR